MSKGLNKRMVKLIIQIPELIRKYIEDNKMTQKDFSDLTRIPVTSLSRLLNSNPQQIDIGTLKKLYGHIPLDFGNLVAVTEDDETPHTPAPVADVASESKRRKVRSKPTNDPIDYLDK